MPARKPASEPVSDIGTEEINTVTVATPQEQPDPLLQQWFEFVRNLPPDAPYDLLNQLPFHQGFVYRVEEMYTSVYDQSITVTFALMIGRNMDSLRKIDSFTIQVPRNTVAPSLAARSIMMPTVVYLMFGRLPPEQPPVPAPAPKPAAQPAPAPAPVAAPEPVEEEAPWQPVRPSAVKPFTVEDMVKRHTPDGLPVMADPYTIERSPEEIVAAILDVFEDAADKADSKAGLTALWNKNQGAVDFVTDFATPAQKEELKTLFKSRAQRFD